MKTIKVMFLIVLMMIGQGTALTAIMVAPMSIGYTTRIVVFAMGFLGTSMLFNLLGFEEGVYKGRTEPKPKHLKIVS